MSEKVVIDGEQVHLTNGDGTRCTAELPRWLKQINAYSIQGMDSEPIADHVRWHVRYGSTSVFILELSPALRRMLWIRDDSPVPFGPEATYDVRRLATPYVIIKVPMRRGRILPRVEVYYRNEPLRTIDGPGGTLYWCNLMNVSPHSYECTAWFCTQYLGAEKMQPGTAGKLSAVVDHLWGGVFTRSSEVHEGSSAFSKAVHDRIDSRVTNIERWQIESDKDPRFVLSVDWKPAEMTVRDLIEAEFRHLKILPEKVSASTLANHLIRAAGKQGEPTS